MKNRTENHRKRNQTKTRQQRHEWNIYQAKPNRTILAHRNSGDAIELILFMSFHIPIHSPYTLCLSFFIPFPFHFQWFWHRPIDAYTFTPTPTKQANSCQFTPHIKQMNVLKENKNEIPFQFHFAFISISILFLLLKMKSQMQHRRSKCVELVCFSGWPIYFQWFAFDLLSLMVFARWDLVFGKWKIPKRTIQTIIIAVICFTSKQTLN